MEAGHANKYTGMIGEKLSLIWQMLAQIAYDGSEVYETKQSNGKGF